VDAAQRFNPARIDNTQIRALRSKYGIPVDSPVIGFVGRIARDKGIAELAQAWSLIRRRWENARLLVIGAVETEAPVSGPVLDLLKSDPRVLMTGHVDPHNLPVHYSLMRVLVMPSYREGFPNVLLEASAMELPIVATRVTGCVDAVIDGVTGILVSVRDCQAFAHAIERYLRDPNLAQGHGRAGRKRVLEEFQPESIWRLLLDEYLRLLREKRIAFLEPRSDEMASNDHTGA
jgi:glycosyltransferase involved in cell wall biosynthesis